MHPTLFHIGSFPIGTFGLMVAIGFFISIQYAGRMAKSIPVKADRVYDLALVIMVAALVGSRIAYIFVAWDLFTREPMKLIFSREGYVFYGGFIGAATAALIMTRRWKLPSWPLADVFAPAIALGHVFGRLGCYLNGCCYGKQCSLGSSLNKFPRIVDEQGNIIGSHVFLDHLSHGWVEASDAVSLPVHPTQLYESFSLLVLFAVLHVLYRRTKWAPGMIFLSYATGYAIIRFCIEFFRADYRGSVFFLSTSQTIAVVVLLAVPFLAMFLKRMNGKKANTTE